MLKLRPFVATLVFAAASAAAAHAAGPGCPGGEISLLVKQLRIDSDRLATQGGSFVLPPGVSIDPATEPATIYVEGDHQALYEADLAGGSFATSQGGSRFVFQAKASQPGVGVGSKLRLKRDGLRYAMALRLLGTGIVTPPVSPGHAKVLLKVGGDCFSAVLACTGHGGGLRCEPERSALLRGVVTGPGGAPLSGVLLTAFDDTRLESVSVFSQEDGHYVFPRLRPATYRLRARLIGYEDGLASNVKLKAHGSALRSFSLSTTDDTNDQVPGSQLFGLLLPKFPNETVRGDFTLSCGNCHQIAGPRFLEDKTTDEWSQVVTKMMSFLPPYHQETRDLMLPLLLDTYGPNATIPKVPVPPPPSGEVLKTTLYEYGLGDDTTRPGCHDLELGEDGVVYAESGVRWIDPRTGERGIYPMDGGGHSLQRDGDGNFWITQNDNDRLAKLDVHTGQFTYYPLPKIGDDQGSYPHTLRFDAQGKIWFTLTKSNHVGRFDPTTAEFTYYRLPTADPAETGLSIPVPYGCDVAPDGTVWWSQLFGQRIGTVNPTTGEVTAWKPPFYGPRRLRVGADGIVWVPGYGSGVLGRFDPTIERWKTYELPTGLSGPPGFGKSDQPYALHANRQDGKVWITGSDSDSLIRFDPEKESFTVFPLPTRGSYTREIVFDPDNNSWTCTSNEPDVKEGKGRGKFVKVELPPSDAVCGNGRVEAGEECDDGNTNDCDSCSNHCRLVTGCGDGTVCGAEQCDDGNTTDCDGCSSSCTLESGLRCGDGMINAACGEECDPPVPDHCSAQCTRIPQCGDGIVDPGEECDDGNTDDCDACSNHCTVVTGCGDGTVCGTEECDDGNTTSCDGCSSSCQVEVGARCGDGITNAACGEQCDPPGPDCTYLCQTGAASALGTRHFSFGGSSFSSALGTSVAIAALSGSMDLVGGAPGIDGVAPVTVTGPLVYSGPILGGSFGTLCFRISSCTGVVDCDGGTAVGVSLVQDSAGPGTQGNPVVVQTGLGADGGPGAALLTCKQSFVQLPPGQSDCTTASYPPESDAVYTTGTVDAHYLNGAPQIGSGAISVTGENLSCAAWTVEDGPGKLATAFLVENDPNAGDTANANLLDD
jgi:cysteine-rich repeat protein